MRPLLESLRLGALPLGFQVKLGLVCGKYLPAGLHAAEASYVSSSSISAFRAAIVRVVWCLLPMLLPFLTFLMGLLMLILLLSHYLV